MKKIALVLASALLFACDKPNDATPPAASASATAAPTASSMPSAAPSASATATPSASAAASASSNAPAKDATVSVLDPVSNPAKSVKVLPGGSVTLYLPQWTSTTWSVTTPDKALGKEKTQMIPGFAGPNTPAQAFTWQTKDLKPGSSHKVVLTNKLLDKTAAPKDSVFTLTVEM